MTMEMTNFADLDFRADDIIDMGECFIVDYPAFSYLMSKDSANNPVYADKGGRHLGEAVPGIAVAFPTKRHGLQLKHFGLGFYDKDDSWGNKAGEPFAYGKGVSVTASVLTKEYLAAALIGDIIMFEGKRWQIAAAPNENIKLLPA